MTGKTHIAIGFATVFITTSLINPTIIQTYPSLILSNALPVSAILELIAVVAAVWFGSLAPDLDQPGSSLSRNVGGPMGTTKFTALVGGLGLLYFAAHLPIVLSPIPYLQVGLVIVGGILLMMSILKHRGLTHSLIGMIVAGVAVYWGLQALLEKGVSFAPGLLLPFLIGYGAHLVADSFTNNGIAPFYVPFVEKTQERWHWPISVTTGEFVDTVVLRIGAMVLVVVGFVH